MQSVLEIPELTRTELSDMATEKKIGIGTVLIIVGLVAGGVWGLHFEFSRVYDRIGDVDKHIARVETAVRIIAAKEGGDTKDLIDEALTVAQNKATSGDKAGAQRALSIANRFLDQQKNARTAALPDFFQQALQKYQQLRLDPNLSATALRGQVILAEYRSALNPPPPLPPKTAGPPPLSPTGPTAVLAQVTYPALTTINFSPPKPVTLEGNGAAIDCRGMQPGQEIITVATRSLEQNPVLIRDLTFIGAQASLDYITWENVTFIGTHIIYHGGPVRLRNVHFVNCTFDVPNNDVGAEVSEYAALQPTQEAKIG